MGQPRPIYLRKHERIELERRLLAPELGGLPLSDQRRVEIQACLYMTGDLKNPEVAERLETIWPSSPYRDPTKVSTLRCSLRKRGALDYLDRLRAIRGRPRSTEKTGGPVRIFVTRDGTHPEDKLQKLFTELRRHLLAPREAVYFTVEELDGTVLADVSLSKQTALAVALSLDSRLRAAVRERADLRSATERFAKHYGLGLYIPSDQDRGSSEFYPAWCPRSEWREILRLFLNDFRRSHFSYRGALPAGRSIGDLEVTVCRLRASRDSNSMVRSIHDQLDVIKMLGRAERGCEIDFPTELRKVSGLGRFGRFMRHQFELATLWRVGGGRWTDLPNGPVPACTHPQGEFRAAERPMSTDLLVNRRDPCEFEPEQRMQLLIEIAESREPALLGALYGRVLASERSGLPSGEWASRAEFREFFGQLFMHCATIGWSDADVRLTVHFLNLFQRLYKGWDRPEQAQGIHPRFNLAAALYWIQEFEAALQLLSQNGRGQDGLPTPPNTNPLDNLAFHTTLTGCLGYRILMRLAEVHKTGTNVGLDHIGYDIDGVVSLSTRGLEIARNWSDDPRHQLWADDLTSRTLGLLLCGILVLEKYDVGSIWISQLTKSFHFFEEQLGQGFDGREVGPERQRSSYQMVKITFARDLIVPAFHLRSGGGTTEIASEMIKFGEVIAGQTDSLRPPDIVKLKLMAAIQQWKHAEGLGGIELASGKRQHDNPREFRAGVQQERRLTLRR